MIIRICVCVCEYVCVVHTLCFKKDIRNYNVPAISSPGKQGEPSKAIVICVSGTTVFTGQSSV